MSTAPLLVELFVEELPPKALKELGIRFAEGVYHALAEQSLVEDIELTAGLFPSPWQGFASPRRLAVLIPRVKSTAPDRAVRQKLMPVSVGLDASGNATPALLKKLQALGADASAVATLQRAIDGKADALFYDSTAQGATLASGLQKALAESIAKLPIPKLMTYQLADGWSDVKFVRPVHSLLALHGSEGVDVQLLGLKAGRSTTGHRFEAAQPQINIRSADSYAQQLAEEGAVIASFEERRAEIVRQLAERAQGVGGGVRPIEDEALLDEVTGLVERPNVLVCQFEKEFLDVPQECLILTMKANQKYFPLLDATGKLTHQFLVVSNIRPDDASAVIQGNERVVRPRLADAKFFFDQDRKKSLASRVEALNKVVYHNKLGTQGERVLRVRAIARGIAHALGAEALARQADRAAMLAKADLLTDMVGEFPELQGTMGRYYAQNDGEEAAIADAIEDHYKPRFAGDALPRNPVGVAVALADKLETLIGLFGIGNLPTGDKDPFALRRHALGVLRMLIDKALPLSLSQLVEIALHNWLDAAASQQVNALAGVEEKLPAFFYDRLAGLLREQGASAQEVEAVLSQRPQHLSDVPRMLTAVRAFASLPEAPALAAANKRIGNILKKSDEAKEPVNPALLLEPAERALYEALQSTVPAADALFEAGDYTASLQTLAALRAPVDAFFDGVMVNADDAPLRRNRLGLLAALHTAMNRVALLERLAV